MLTVQIKKYTHTHVYAYIHTQWNMMSVTLLYVLLNLFYILKENITCENWKQP